MRRMLVVQPLKRQLRMRAVQTTLPIDKNDLVSHTFCFKILETSLLSG